jgi:Flp pilus assembly secretin CpaC
LNGEGRIAYKDLPPYLAEVLGVLEECNIKLELIRELQAESLEGGVAVHGNTTSMESTVP